MLRAIRKRLDPKWAEEERRREENRRIALVIVDVCEKLGEVPPEDEVSPEARAEIGQLFRAIAMNARHASRFGREFRLPPNIAEDVRFVSFVTVGHAFTTIAADRGSIGEKDLERVMGDAGKRLLALAAAAFPQEAAGSAIMMEELEEEASG